VSHYARCQRARGRAPGTTISTSTTNQGDDANMVSGGSVSSTIPCIPEPNMLPNDGITLDGEDMRALDNGTRHPGAPSKDFSDTTGHRTSRAWSQQLSQRSPRTVSKQGGSIGSSRLKSQALVGPAIPVDPSVMYPELCPGMCLYINLDRRTDRKKRMEELAAPNPWLSKAMRRIPAVDGRNLSFRKLVSENLLTREAAKVAERAAAIKKSTIGATPEECSGHLTLGGCGCALSHRAAWETLVDSKQRWAVIFEDDLQGVCDDFDRQMAIVVRSLPATWMFCYIGFHVPGNGGKLLPGGEDVTGPLFTPDPSMWLAGLYGYMIKRPYAELLLEQAFPMGSQIDEIVGCLVADSGKGYAMPPDQFLVYSPPTEDSRDTDIQTFPDQMG